MSSFVLLKCFFFFAKEMRHAIENCVEYTLSSLFVVLHQMWAFFHVINGRLAEAEVACY